MYLTVLSLATLRLCLKHSMPARFRSGSGERYALVDCAGGTPKRLLKRVKKAHRTWLASEMVLAPARRSSVTSRSWKGAVGPFYPTLRLRRTREDLLHPKLCHRTTELGRRRRLMRARYILEDGVAVTVQGQRNPTTPDQLLHEEEIAMSVLFMAKQCVGHGAGGIIDCQQQGASRAPFF